MTREFPDWQPFPLNDAATPPLELSGMRGSTLVLLALPEADESGWAVRAAARIARQRAGRTRRLLLADLDLMRPRLHMELRTDDGEGATDLLLYGASLRRVARPVEAGFLFVSAGTAVADPAPALTSPRLDVLVQGFEDADAELFLFLPWSSPARDRVLSRAGNVVILGERDEIESGTLPELDGLRIGAVLGPGGGADRPASPEPAVAEPSTMDDPAEASPPDAAHSAHADVDPEVPDAPERDGVHEDPTTPSRSQGERSPRRTIVIVLGVLLVLLAALVIAALLGLLEFPGVPTLAADDGASEVRVASFDSILEDAFRPLPVPE